MVLGFGLVYILVGFGLRHHPLDFRQFGLFGYGRDLAEARLYKGRVLDVDSSLFEWQFILVPLRTLSSLDSRLCCLCYRFPLSPRPVVFSVTLGSLRGLSVDSRTYRIITVIRQCG
jgi:hypothetical protein